MPAPKNPSAAHDRHHAEKRRARRDSAKAGSNELHQAPLVLYGLHTVRGALGNPARIKHKLHATRNALTRLQAEPNELDAIEVNICEPRKLDRLAGPGAVHQGIALECEPLAPLRLEDVSASPLLLVLDQVTDPHNVGAVLRSAVACGAGAVITTARHSPSESGVLAKAASGAMDLVGMVEVRNLAEGLIALKGRSYQVVGLDSEAHEPLENALSGDRIALVLGAEGKGMREKTRQTCDTLARIDLPGAIRSLNVSNAAVLALYIAQQHLRPA